MAQTLLMYDSDAGTVVMDFDAIELESPRASVAITEYPVEQGTPLIDNVRQVPVSMRLRVVVSDTPIRADAKHMDGLVAFPSYGVQVIRRGIDIDPISGIRSMGDPIQVPPRVATVVAELRTWQPAQGRPHGQFRAMRVYKIYQMLLTAMQEARECLVVSEPLGSWSQMLIKSLATDRDANSGSALSVDIELIQVGYAVLYQRDVSALMPKSAPTQARSKKPKNRRAPAKPAEKPAAAKADEVAPKESAASQLVDENPYLKEWRDTFRRNAR